MRSLITGVASKCIEEGILNSSDSLLLLLLLQPKRIVSRKLCKPIVQWFTF